MMRRCLALLGLLLACPLLAGAQPAHDHGPADAPRVAVEVPSQQQARMGVRVSPARTIQASHTLRAPGILQIHEGREVHVHTRVPGWIEELHVDHVGQLVEAGGPLFSLYSPDLVNTQAEYVAALDAGEAGQALAVSALRRLRNLGVPEREISEIARTRSPKRLITFESPISGYVVDKNAIRGLYVTPDAHLYYLADLDDLWVMATLYEADLAVVATGDEVTISLPHQPRRRIRGTIGFIYPEVSQDTRAGRARIDIRNPDRTLRPGMYVNVEMRKALGWQLVIPGDSVIETGLRSLVFVQTGPSTFEPREISTGPRIGDQFIVQEGLAEGELVVTAANFLIDAESKLRATLDEGRGAPAPHIH